MTSMLASVTGPEEAAIALAGGADIIDLKDPARGGLGGVDPATVAETVRFLAGRRPVSALAADADSVAPLAAAGVDYVKLPIAHGGPDVPIADVPIADVPIADVPTADVPTQAMPGVKLVAILFADQPLDLSLLPRLGPAGFAGVMLDTAVKTRGRLLDLIDMPALQRFVDACAAHGLISAIAGSLELPDVPRLTLLRPDVLGFRAALCGPAGRGGRVTLDAVRKVRALIPAEPLAAPQLTESATDRVYLHELVLPLHVGAYAHERGAPQRVRFDVDVLIARAAAPAHDLPDIFSYDVIEDAIRLQIEAGHVSLIETLAERIAAMLLAYPRVMKVTARLEKLDSGPRRVGVVIERTRADLAPRAGSSAKAMIRPNSGRGA